MSEPDNASARDRSGWASAGVALAVGLLWMMMLGTGIIEDCKSDPWCTGACQDDCDTTYYRHLAFATAFVAVVGVFATRRFGTRAWQLIGVATAVASIGLIIFR